jgi:hypothetical protein
MRLIEEDDGAMDGLLAGIEELGVEGRLELSLIGEDDGAMDDLLAEIEEPGAEDGPELHFP